MTDSLSGEDKPVLPPKYEPNGLPWPASEALRKAMRHADDVPEHVLREAFRWVNTTEPCRAYGAELFAAACIRHAIEAGVLKVVDPR